MTDPLTPEEQREILAAELALGMLDGSDRAAAMRLCLEDRDFAARVAYWEDQTGDWFEDLPEEEASPEMWSRIGESIRDASSTSIVQPVPPRGAGQGWRSATIAASLVAVMFAALWMSSMGRPVQPSTRPYKAELSARSLSVAQITGDAATGESRQLVAAVYDRSKGELILRLSDIDVGDRVPELWVIGADAQPRSLGFVTPNSAVRLTLPKETRRAFVAGATLAISLEAPSPTKHETPQGPILGTAQLSDI